MIAIVAPLLFLFAFAFACATIQVMLTSHGGKMIAALRMDHRPHPRRVVGSPVATQPVYAELPLRAARRPVPAGRLRAA